jgi:Fanconi anemia group D2 protein
LILQQGVIGAVTYAACLNEKDSPEKVREVIDMLELVHKSCAASTSSSKSQFWSQINPQGSEMLSMSVFNDELCLAIQANSLSKVIKGWVLDRFGGILENNYLGDLEVMTGDGNGNGRLVVKDKNDRSLIEGSAKNNNAPKAELRYNIDNEDAIVYLKLLSLHASEKYQEREVLPHQLCPLLRLMTVAYDERYGGDGIDNIDALLGCPVLLPDSSICGVDFTYLSDEQKLTTVSTLFTAVSCFREIINSFIYTAVFGPSGCTQLTQEHENLRKKVVTKLRFLLILEEELILCAKKCHSFAPPGTSPLPIPKDLSDYAEKNNLQHVTNDLPPVDTEDVGRMTEREKKAFNNIKRAAKRKEMEQMKSKQKLLRLKAKYENSLETRTRSALRSLSPYVSLALGFPELRVTGLSASNQELITPLRTSELKCTKIGDGVTHSLLQLFNDGLKALLNHDSSHSSNFYFENFTANPYVISKEGAKVQRQRNECQTFLLSCIEGDVFVSVHERLVSAAEILSDDEIDEDVKKEATTCTLLLMGCMEILLNSNELKSLEGKPYFDTIIKQIADGERTSTIFTAMPDTTRLKTIRALFALLEETVTGRDTNDLTFVITGVECIHLLVQRASAIIDGAREDEKKSYSNYLKSMKLQLSKLCQDLLRRQWKEGTSLNKSNVGILLSLFLEYSELECANLSTSNFDPMKWGRINAINVLTTQALLKLPETHECKGPVQEFSTCYRSTFGLFYSAVLNAITKEISDLFQSPQSKMVENAGACLSTLKILISMTLAMSDLLKNNPSLASRSNLLTQIKIGTKFVDVTVKRAIPFCAAHFQSFDETIVEMLKDIQKISSQLSFIVAHGKRIKDTYLIREGPNVRKSTEGFLHHTKSVLQKNGVLDAFWSGHFNNRNIDGSKVVERTRQESDSAAESSDTESEVEYE